jgi:hypothetical protein
MRALRAWAVLLLAGATFGLAGPVPAPSSGVGAERLWRSVSATAKAPDPVYGVDPGVVLSRRSGDLVITKRGTVVENLDLSGAILVKADDVTIRNSIIRGGPAATGDKALIMSWWGAKRLKISHVTLRADNPSRYLDGISGVNLTAEYLDISRVVDGVKLTGGVSTVRRSFIHDGYSTADPSQPDGVSHNDGIQVIQNGSGSRITISHDHIRGFGNSAIMITQRPGNRLVIQNNTLSDGACQVNMVVKGGGKIGSKRLSLKANRFNPGRYGRVCPARLPRRGHGHFVLSDNRWLSDHKSIKVQWY